MKTLPIGRKSEIVVQEMKDELLVYDLKVNRAICLNQTSAMVWKHCDGKRTAAQISDEMSIQMKTLVSENIVWLALEQLGNGGFLEDGFEGNKKFIGDTRREAIKKIALASAIALPIVSSIIAPKATQAQSACGVGYQLCDCVFGTGNNFCGQGSNSGTPFRGFCPDGCLCRGSGFKAYDDEVGTCE